MQTIKGTSISRIHRSSFSTVLYLFVRMSENTIAVQNFGAFLNKLFAGNLILLKREMDSYVVSANSSESVLRKAFHVGWCMYAHQWVSTCGKSSGGHLTIRDLFCCKFSRIDDRMHAMLSCNCSGVRRGSWTDFRQISARSGSTSSVQKFSRSCLPRNRTIGCGNDQRCQDASDDTAR